MYPYYHVACYDFKQARSLVSRKTAFNKQYEWDFGVI